MSTEFRSHPRYSEGTHNYISLEGTMSRVVSLPVFSCISFPRGPDVISLFQSPYLIDLIMCSLGPGGLSVFLFPDLVD